MTTLLQTPASDAASFAPISADIADACARIAPLWPLQSFVAVNPFVGLSDRSFADACALMRRVTRGGMLMPAAYYRAQGAACVTDADLKTALRRNRSPLSVAELRDWLERDHSVAAPLIPTVCQALSAWRSRDWTAFIVDEVSKWCSAFYDAGQASWRMPWRDLPLFAAWKNAAIDDANPEMMGLSGFREFVSGLPDDPRALIEGALDELGVAPELRADFLHRQLLSVGGWSAYTQYLAREKAMRGQTDGALEELLAIRLAYDLALFQRAGEDFAAHWRELLAGVSSETDGAGAPEYLWQLAAEIAHQRGLVERMRAATTDPTRVLEKERAHVQAAFCIDVRSEVLRRHLEATSPGIETIGFAGFFGFAIEYVPLGASRGNAQCPVLLLPKHRIEGELANATPAQTARWLDRHNFARQLGVAWNSFKTSAISCFAFVETGGVLAGAKLVKDSCALGHHDDEVPTQPQVTDDAIALEDQIATAAGALRGMGLTRDFARLVLICGHGSTTTNNPYAAGLDCGACGGHSGDANARVAVAVLNDPRVRAGLGEQGISIPDDTWFVAGLHNTTTDDATLFDAQDAPASHAAEIEKLRRHLASAGHNARAERAGSLGLAGENVDARVRLRGRDWSQTRPEWGLAGNAAFIAAPRARTAALNLRARAFLHNYDFRDDPQGAVLTVIMTAPMVVASWINLQYFGSTVNNAQWGSGNKTIHNVVGTLGVWEGNAGDLQSGLPLQSVHDGQRFVHEPLRLSVFIEAPRAMIEAVIEANDGVRDLVDKGWVHIVAIEDEGRAFWGYRGDLMWEGVGASA